MREMDRHAAAAALERALVGADEVLRLLLELDIGVADQAEHALAGDAEAGKEPVEIEADQAVQHDEADRLRRGCRAGG